MAKSRKSKPENNSLRYPKKQARISCTQTKLPSLKFINPINKARPSTTGLILLAKRGARDAPPTGGFTIKDAARCARPTSYLWAQAERPRIVIRRTPGPVPDTPRRRGCVISKGKKHTVDNLTHSVLFRKTNRFRVFVFFCFLSIRAALFIVGSCDDKAT